MRVAALLLVIIAAALPAAHAQTVEKTKPAAEAAVKPPAAAKPAVQGKAATATESGKSKIEGVATQRSTPAEMKKDSDDCHHKGKASDA
jgi:hypothetical protein